MSSSTSQDVRCPGCAALLRAGSPWCTLCYADLRPAPEPVLRVAVPSPTYQEEVAGPPEDSPGVDTTEQGTRRGRRRRATPEAEIEEITARMLAELAASERSRPLGAVAGVLDSKGKRVALMVGAGVVVTALLIVVMFLGGALL